MMKDGLYDCREEPWNHLLLHLEVIDQGERICELKGSLTIADYREKNESDR